MKELLSGVDLSEFVDDLVMTKLAELGGNDELGSHDSSFVRGYRTGIHDLVTRLGGVVDRCIRCGLGATTCRCVAYSTEPNYAED